MSDWTLHHGEALAWLLSLPDASADALITDPPYSSGGAFRSDRTQSTSTKYVSTDAALGLATEAGDLGWRRQTGRTTADVYWLAQGGAVMVWGPAANPGEWWAWQGASDATRHETERDALMAAMAAWGVT